MPLSVFAADEQSDLPVEVMRWIKLAELVLRDEGVRGETEVSLIFVDETTISDLNQRFLGKDGPTDVLAFPIDEEPVEGGRSPDSGGTGPGFNPSPEEAPTLLGDVVICPTVAARNAPDHAGTFDDEVALLVVHGLLHLLGHDHEDPEEAEAMEAKERDLLGRHHGPLPDTAWTTAAEAADDGETEAGATPAGTTPAGAASDGAASDGAAPDGAAPAGDCPDGGASAGGSVDPDGDGDGPA